MMVYTNITIDPTKNMNHESVSTNYMQHPSQPPPPPPTPTPRKKSILMGNKHAKEIWHCARSQSLPMQTVGNNNKKAEETKDAVAAAGDDGDGDDDDDDKSMKREK